MNLNEIFVHYFTDSQFREYLISLGFVFQDEDHKLIKDRLEITKIANSRGWFWSEHLEVWYDICKDQKLYLSTQYKEKPVIEEDKLEELVREKIHKKRERFNPFNI